MLRKYSSNVKSTQQIHKYININQYFKMIINIYIRHFLINSIQNIKFKEQKYNISKVGTLRESIKEGREHKKMKGAWQMKTYGFLKSLKNY